jgi:hypothetical protein
MKAMPIKKDKPDDYSKGHRDLRLPGRGQKRSFRGEGGSKRKSRLAKGESI